MLLYWDVDCVDFVDLFECVYDFDCYVGGEVDVGIVDWMCEYCYGVDVFCFVLM